MATTDSKNVNKVNYDEALKAAGTDRGKAERIKLKHQLNLLRGQLELGISTFRAQYLDLAYHMAPRRTRFLITDVNRGDKRWASIIKNTAGRAARTLRAGMMSACTSPTRPWFRLEPLNKELSKIDSVKEWCFKVTEALQMIFSRTNFYQVMPILYGDGGVFATGAAFVEEDIENVARFYSLPIGSYTLSRDAKGRVNTLCRVYPMTVRSIVETFGKQKDGSINWDPISKYVQEQWDNGNYQMWVDVCHFVLPNPQFRPNALGPNGFQFLSLYYELGIGNSGNNAAAAVEQSLPLDQFLRMKGYNHMPVLDFIWERTGEDDYGTSSPGMEALADIRTQQLVMRRIFQAMEYKLRPPMAAPVSLKSQKSSLLPGEITYGNNPADMEMKPIYQVEFGIKEAMVVEENVKQEINEAFMTDLFRTMLDDDRRMPPTAEEVSERKQEGLLQLGPVMQNLNDGVLDPAVMLLYVFAQQQGRLPPPPPELHGQGVGVIYISLAAQAMKLMGLAGLDRLMGMMDNLGKIAPTSMDVFDTDEFGRSYADMLSAPPLVVRGEDKIAAIRADRQKQAAAQQQQVQQQQHAETAKTLAAAPTQEPNMLTELMGQAQAGNMMPTR